ncbi:hypothetical protein WL422_12955, partial [Staphylococcus epidermidis]
MNVTEYIRQTAVGNRIKPTVIEYPKEQITMDDSNSKNNTNNLYKVIEHLEEDNEALKSDRDALRQRHDQLEDDIEQYK